MNWSFKLVLWKMKINEILELKLEIGAIFNGGTTDTGFHPDAIAHSMKIRNSAKNFFHC